MGFLQYPTRQVNGLKQMVGGCQQRTAMNYASRVNVDTPILAILDCMVDVVFDLQFMVLNILFVGLHSV